MFTRGSLEAIAVGVSGQPALLRAAGRLSRPGGPDEAGSSRFRLWGGLE